MDNLAKADKIVSNLKRLPNGWNGDSSKKPSIKALNKTKKVLKELETYKLPWPSVVPVKTGGIIMTWVSVCKDIMVVIDPDGDIQFNTSLKKIDIDSGEVVERMESDGHILDVASISHMLAWFCLDQAAQC